MSSTHLTTEELSSRIKYDTRTTRERLKGSVLLEGVHYIRPFGGCKILFIRERIERDMAVVSLNATLPIPMSAVVMNAMRDQEKAARGKCASKSTIASCRTSPAGMVPYSNVCWRKAAWRMPSSAARRRFRGSRHDDR